MSIKPNNVATLNGSRLLGAFAIGMEGQAEAIRQITGEAERFARDSALLALTALRDSLRERGITVSNEEISKAMNESLGVAVEKRSVTTFAKQAARRKVLRNGNNPFNHIEKTIKQIRAVKHHGEE